MRFYQTILILLAVFAFLSCADNRRAATPLDTLKVYNLAIKQKDVAKMKSLLSKGSLKMAEEEAKAQGVSVDEIVQGETFYSPGQTTVKIRNEKIEGDKATIEVENSLGTWDTVPFIKEDGKWKIAKERFAEETLKKAEEGMKTLDEQINQDKQP